MATSLRPRHDRQMRWSSAIRGLTVAPGGAPLPTHARAPAHELIRAPIRALLLVPFLVLFLVSACAPVRTASRDTTPVTDVEVLTMDIAPGTVPCQGEALQRCLRVRLGSDTAWTLFYDRIEGFTPEAGTGYRIQVERRTVEHPKADASRFSYRLVRILSRSPGPGG